MHPTPRGAGTAKWFKMLIFERKCCFFCPGASCHRCPCLVVQYQRPWPQVSVVPIAVSIPTLAWQPYDRVRWHDWPGSRQQIVLLLRSDQPGHKWNSSKPFGRLWATGWLSMHMATWHTPQGLKWQSTENWRTRNSINSHFLHHWPFLRRMIQSDYAWKYKKCPW